MLNKTELYGVDYTECNISVILKKLNRVHRTCFLYLVVSTEYNFSATSNSLCWVEHFFYFDFAVPNRRSLIFQVVYTEMTISAFSSRKPRQLDNFKLAKQNFALLITTMLWKKWFQYLSSTSWLTVLLENTDAFSIRKLAFSVKIL